jgi:hypothetical protein
VIKVCGCAAPSGKDIHNILYKNIKRGENVNKKFVSVKK